MQKAATAANSLHPPVAKGGYVVAANQKCLSSPVITDNILTTC